MKYLSDVQRYFLAHKKIKISCVLLCFPLFAIYFKEVLKINKPHKGLVVLKYYCGENYNST